MIFCRRVEGVFLYPTQVERALLCTNEYPELLLRDVVYNNRPNSLRVGGWKEGKFDTEPMPGDKKTTPNNSSTKHNCNRHGLDFGVCAVAQDVEGLAAKYISQTCES